MAEESGFVIDSTEYPIPGLETFNLDEAEILYDSCGMSLEDFVIDDEDEDQVKELERKAKHPGFVRALMLVAYIRGNEGMTRRRAEATIGKANLFEAMLQLVKAGVTEDPTEPQKNEESTESLSESSSGSGSSSGAISRKSSAKPAPQPESTGTSE